MQIYDIINLQKNREAISIPCETFLRRLAAVKERGRKMKIIDVLNSGKVSVSCELFPPKAGGNFSPVVQAADAIAALRPDFMSVTYGAGGGTSQNTVAIASHIQNDLGITALAHLTCVSSTKDHVAAMLDRLKEEHIENILALRGDIPEGMDFPTRGSIAMPLS